MAITEMECLDGTVEVVVFPDVLDKYEGQISENAAVLVTGRLSRGDGVAIHATEIAALGDAPDRLAQRLSIHLAASHLEEGRLDDVKRVLSSHPGSVPVVMCVMLPGGEKVFVEADDIFKVAPSEDLISEIEHLLGEESVYVAVRGAS